MPKKFTFGDAWIIRKPDRILSLQPDIVLKTDINGVLEFRLIGELNLCITVNLDMITQAKTNQTSALSDVLGMSSSIS